VVYMAVSLVTVDCIGGLLTRYPTVDSMVDMGGTSEPAWNKDKYNTAKTVVRDKKTRA